MVHDRELSVRSQGFDGPRKSSPDQLGLSDVRDVRQVYRNPESLRLSLHRDRESNAVADTVRVGHFKIAMDNKIVTVAEGEGDIRCLELLVKQVDALLVDEGAGKDCLAKLG